MSDPIAETGALDWSLTAMRESTDRLLRAGTFSQAVAFLRLAAEDSRLSHV